MLQFFCRRLIHVINMTVLLSGFPLNSYVTSNVMILLMTSLLVFNTFTRLQVYSLFCCSIGRCFSLSFNVICLDLILGLWWLSWEPWLGRTQRWPGRNRTVLLLSYPFRLITKTSTKVIIQYVLRTICAIFTSTGPCGDTRLSWTLWQ